MENFIYQNPTKILFGKGQIANIAQEIPADARVLLLYGGGSILRNGIHSQVRQALGDREVREYGGIEANPDFDTLMPAAKMAAEPGTFLLAVGGGSVLDGAKFVAAAARFEGDPWTILAPTFAPVREFIPRNK